MSLTCRQQRLLQEIERAACRSDPRLASLLAIFGQLTAGEDMPGGEQLRTPLLTRLRAATPTAAAAAAAAITRATTAAASAIRAAAAALHRRSRPAGRAAAPRGTRGTTDGQPPRRAPGPAGPVLAVNDPQGGHMRFIRRTSPLPPDPAATAGSSPLPPDPAVTGGSPLPPDPLPDTRPGPERGQGGTPASRNGSAPVSVAAR